MVLKVAWLISSARCFFNSALRARLVSGLSYLFRHHIPNRLRKDSCRARPMRDVDVCELWVLGRSLLISTRHFLIRIEAGSSDRMLERVLLFRRLRLDVFGEPGVFFQVGVGGVVLSSGGCVFLLSTVMVGTVAGAVCMGLARSSMVCRVGKVRFVVDFCGRGAGHVPIDELRVV